MAPQGGVNLDRQPRRAVPSLRYLDNVPEFTRHRYIDHGAEREDLGPAGGLMWDGRVDTLQAQALLPLRDPAEMANPSDAALAERLIGSGYADCFRRLFGPGIFDRPDNAVAAAARALAQFQLEEPGFRPFSSRYDRFLAGGVQLTAEELRGLRWFTDPAKGNCADCHPVTPGPGERPPAFTDYAYHALGVPRSPLLAGNVDGRFRDLGLCGPLRADLWAETRYCGYYRTPSLRNTAQRHCYFHNCRFTTLKQVLQFYAERDTAPEKWYPSAGGQTTKFDDLPPAYRKQVDVSTPPFGRPRGAKPALSAAEIADLLAFLRTLDDSDEAAEPAVVKAH